MAEGEQASAQTIISHEFVFCIGLFCNILLCFDSMRKTASRHFYAAGQPSLHACCAWVYLYAICYLFKGINTFASSLFTGALRRNYLCFSIIYENAGSDFTGASLLPYVIKVDGIWLAVPLAEFLSVLLSLFCLPRLFKTKLK